MFAPSTKRYERAPQQFCLLPIFQPKSTIIGLIKEMIAKFEEELPLYSLSSSDADRQSELLSYIARITEGADVFIYL